MNPSRAVALTAFPTTLLVALAALYWMPRLGVPLPAAQAVAFLTALVAGVLLERYIPFDAAWHRPVDSDTVADGWSFGGAVLAVDPFLKSLSGPLIASALAFLGLPAALHLFPSELPFAGAVAVGLLIAEFGGYWAHRLAHRGGWMWRFHSIHHSSRRLYWLNSFRSHPINIAWHHLSGAFILMLIGTPQHILLSVLAVSGVGAIFQHLNARLEHGFLNYVFSTNELHRWHHSDKRGESNHNYGSVLIVWDLLFGTYLNRCGQRPATLGLWDGRRLPRQYHQLLVAPFQKRHWTQPADGSRVSPH
jgi:sterol desaturase/sphingolipid hydroxylase (fatty acid hydroxylase superfamily)